MARTHDTRRIAPPQTDVPETPASAKATKPGVLKLNELALIGIAGSPENRIAILRERNGDILTVHNGDTTPKGRVAGIGDAEVILARAGGRQTRLRLPE